MQSAHKLLFCWHMLPVRCVTWQPFCSYCTVSTARRKLLSLSWKRACEQVRKIYWLYNVYTLSLNSICRPSKAVANPSTAAAVARACRQTIYDVVHSMLIQHPTLSCALPQHWSHTAWFLVRVLTPAVCIAQIDTERHAMYSERLHDIYSFDRRGVELMLDDIRYCC
jgi:hypothetical protein